MEISPSPPTLSFISVLLSFISATLLGSAVMLVVDVTTGAVVVVVVGAAVVVVVGAAVVVVV